MGQGLGSLILNLKSGLAYKILEVSHGGLVGMGDPLLHPHDHPLVSMQSPSATIFLPSLCACVIQMHLDSNVQVCYEHLTCSTVYLTTSLSASKDAPLHVRIPIKLRPAWNNEHITVTTVMQ